MLDRVPSRGVLAALLALTALLALPALAAAAGTPFGSGARTIAFATDPGPDPQPDPANDVPVGYKCLNATYPIGGNCFSGDQYDFPEAGWFADLSPIPGAHWIWGLFARAGDRSDGAELWFVTFVDVPRPTSEGVLRIAADDFAEVRVNGQLVGSVGSVTDPDESAANEPLTTFDIGPYVHQGRNSIVVHAVNGPASFSDRCSDTCTYSQNPAGVVYGGSIGGPVEVETCFGEIATIAGSAGPDELIGTPGRDVISAGAGNDTVAGADGDDYVCGGPGADRLTGGDGIDNLQGGDDTVRERMLAGQPTGDRADHVDGGYGIDFLEGQDGNDRLYGGPYGDLLDGGRGSDRLYGGTGGDALVAGILPDDASGADVLIGDAGDDLMYGAGGRDSLLGGIGDDRMNGAGGNDVVNGGLGADRAEPLPSFFYLALPNGQPDVLETGNDLVRGGKGDDHLDGGPGMDRLLGEQEVDTCLNGEVFSSCELR